MCAEGYASRGSGHGMWVARVHYGPDALPFVPVGVVLDPLPGRRGSLFRCFPPLAIHFASAVVNREGGRVGDGWLLGWAGLGVGGSIGWCARRSGFGFALRLFPTVVTPCAHADAELAGVPPPLPRPPCTTTMAPPALLVLPQPPACLWCPGRTWPFAATWARVPLGTWL